MRLRGEPTAPGHSLTSNSDAGNPWGPGCPPEGAGTRRPFPKALVGLLPSPLPWPHLRVSISGAHLCFSWDPQTGPRALPQRRHRRCGARGLLPAPCGWTFRVPGQTMGPHITGEVAGTGTWTMGLCFSPRLPAAALSPGAAREAEPSKAQRCTRRVPSAAAQRPGRGRGAPLSHPPSLPPRGRTMLLFP